jgi:predicted nuclease of predicted toxin-antitoxin system
MTSTLHFVADMNLSPLTVNALRKDGWDIVRVSGFIPVDATDDEILVWARGQNRILITQDLDFSTLLAVKGFSRPSLITLRLSNTDPDMVTSRLKSIIALVGPALREGSAVTVDDRNVRIRRLPIR